MCFSVASMRRDGAEDADTADSGWRTRRKNSNAREEFVGEGTPGCRYQLSVSAVNAGGTSLPSECVYVSIPPAVPSPPSSFSAVPQGLPFAFFFFRKCKFSQSSHLVSCPRGVRSLIRRVYQVDYIS